MEKKKDNTFNFFNEYLLKYMAEITDFNNEIEVNKSDEEVFWGAGAIIHDPEMYTEEQVEQALKIYDPLAFYHASGLIKLNHDNNKFYINPTKLQKKVNEFGNVKMTDADEKYEVVSVYTKKA